MMKSEIKNGIVLSVCVILIVVLVYFSTAYFMTGEIGDSKKKSNNDGNVTQTEQSSVGDNYKNMIIASKTFDIEEQDYMVMFFSEKKVSETLSNALLNYDSKGADINLYKVNTDEVINSYVKSNQDNSIPNSSDELKIKDKALITISSGKVSSYVTNESDIINALK